MKVSKKTIGDWCFTVMILGVCFFACLIIHEIFHTEALVPAVFVVIPMDALLIEQVLINILENAVQHAKGMQKLWISVSLKNEKALFEIVDDGEGIAEHRLCG